MASRPVFSAALGDAFKALRTAHTNWSQNHAASRADEARLPGLSRNVIWRLEAGKIKHPSADTLRSLAKLYSCPHDQVVATIAAIIYGVSDSTSELPRQTRMQSSESKAHSGEASHGGSTTARSLADERARTRKLTRELINLGTKLNEILTDLGDQQELERARKPRAARSPRVRKAG